MSSINCCGAAHFAKMAWAGISKAKNNFPFLCLMDIMGHLLQQSQLDDNEVHNHHFISEKSAHHHVQISSYFITMS